MGTSSERKKRRNRSRSGAQIECPQCRKKLRGEKGLKMHWANEHPNVPLPKELEKKLERQAS